MAIHNALPPVELLCQQCGKAFTVVGSQVKEYASRQGRTRKFCSEACSRLGRLKVPPIFECAYCGVTTERKRFVNAAGKKFGWDYTQKFCSKACGYKRPRSTEKPGQGVSDSRRISSDQVAWWQTYAWHRLVMEAVLGRRLLAHENVHHLDGNRTNNDPSNLELWSTSQPCGQRIADKVSWAVELIRTYPEIAREIGVALVTPEQAEIIRDVINHETGGRLLNKASKSSSISE